MIISGYHELHRQVEDWPNTGKIEGENGGESRIIQLILNGIPSTMTTTDMVSIDFTNFHRQDNEWKISDSLSARYIEAFVALKRNIAEGHDSFG